MSDLLTPPFHTHKVLHSETLHGLHLSLFRLGNQRVNGDISCSLATQVGSLEVSDTLLRLGLDIFLLTLIHKVKRLTGHHPRHVSLNHIKVRIHILSSFFNILQFFG